jgi:hypothetical protein
MAAIAWPPSCPSGPRQEDFSTQQKVRQAMTPTGRIPPPHPSDSGDVTEALDVASTLWRTGNCHDAIRWIRRAAEAADEAGDSPRMNALARASAELEESLAAAPPTPKRLSVPPPLPSGARSSVPPPPESASRAKSKTTPPPLPQQVKRPAPTSTAPPQSRLRFRVSIKTSALDPTRLVVRRLEDGMAVPAGTSEGWLETSESTNLRAAQTNGKSVR